MSRRVNGAVDEADRAGRFRLAGRASRVIRAGLLSPASRARVAAIGLWVLVGAGALGLPVSLAAGSRSAPSSPVSPASSSGAGPSGFAELFVAAYLQAGAGREDMLRPFLADPPQLPRTPAGRWYAARTAVLDAVRVSPGYWAVTVAVDVMSVDRRGYTPVGLRCYRVSVQASPDGAAVGRSGVDTGADAPSYVAAGLPTLVAAPARAPAWPLARAAAPLPAGSPPAQTVTRFLAAYLGGEGELSRYTAPGVGLGAVTPAPFAAVTVDQVAPAARVDAARVAALEVVPDDGDRLEVLAEVSAADAGGAVQQLTYGLRLTARGGRWEVSGLDEALPLGPASPDPVATTLAGQPGTGTATSPPAGTPAPSR